MVGCQWKLPKPLLPQRFGVSSSVSRFLSNISTAALKLIEYSDPGSPFHSYMRENYESPTHSSQVQITRDTRGKDPEPKNSPFNIAVVGYKESGKSTLIDALRGISNGSKDSARNKPAQDAPTPFPDTNVSNYSRRKFIWTEYPSYNGVGFQSDYFIQQNIHTFNAVLVLVDVRITEYDIGILQECVINGIPYLIVRSKTDQHIRNVYQSIQNGEDDDDDDEDGDKPVSSAEDSRILEHARNVFIQDTSQNFSEALSKAGFSPAEPANKVFLVSSSVLRNVVKGNDRLKGAHDEEELIQRLTELSDY